MLVRLASRLDRARDVLLGALLRLVERRVVLAELGELLVEVRDRVGVGGDALVDVVQLPEEVLDRRRFLRDRGGSVPTLRSSEAVRKGQKRTFSASRVAQRSASFFISLYCLISPLTPLRRPCCWTLCSVAFSSSAAALSYASLRSSEPEIWSMSLARSLGDCAATASTSPWNTRKFLALTRMLNVSSWALYFLYVATVPFRRYSDWPEAVMLSGAPRGQP